MRVYFRDRYAFFKFSNKFSKEISLNHIAVNEYLLADAFLPSSGYAEDVLPASASESRRRVEEPLKTPPIPLDFLPVDLTGVCLVNLLVPFSPSSPSRDINRLANRRDVSVKDR